MAMTKSTGLLVVCVLGLSVACVGLLIALLVRSDITGSSPEIPEKARDPGAPIISGNYYYSHHHKSATSYFNGM